MTLGALLPKREFISLLLKNTLNPPECGFTGGFYQIPGGAAMCKRQNIERLLIASMEVKST
jgi:hypothetical protein